MNVGTRSQVATTALTEGRETAVLPRDWWAQQREDYIVRMGLRL